MHVRMDGGWRVANDALLWLEHAGEVLDLNGDTIWDVSGLRISSHIALSLDADNNLLVLQGREIITIPPQ